MTSAAFSARQTRPWEPSPNPSTCSSFGSSTSESRIFYGKQLANRGRVTIAKSLLKSSSSDRNTDDEGEASSSPDEEINSLSPSRLFLDSATDLFTKQTEKEELTKYVVNGAAFERAPTVASCLKPLFQLTRPRNFPGVILLHCLGVYLSLRSTGQSHLFVRILFKEPSLWIVLTALLLTSSTSMVVNDYYDKKLGRDSDKTTSPLVSGELNLQVVRNFLNYLYAIALICVALVPGVPARISVVVGLMLTFWYTKHLKPRTFIKNVMCATLIALSPFTSGSAALKVASEIGAGPWGSLRVLAIPSLWRLVMMLFWGVCGREIYMDMTDLQDDLLNNVRTIPVKYGRRYACGVALICYVMGSLTVMSGPFSQFFSQLSSSFSLPALKAVLAANAGGGMARRMFFASAGTFMLLRRGIQIFASKGEDDEIIKRTVEEAQLTMILCLGSFI